jgi:phospholipid/cholesterol/gamma-HCH transport system permease protein
MPDDTATDTATLTPLPAPTGGWALGGAWTAAAAGSLRLEPASSAPALLDGTALTALDSAGAWVLRRWLGTARPALQAWPPRADGLMKQVLALSPRTLPAPPRSGLLRRTGLLAVGAATHVRDFAAFVGELALAGLRLLRPARGRSAWHWRVLLREIQLGGYDALPIIGVTAFLLGVVVAYQGADQLRHYGANVFVVELVGYAMLREFAPLIGAIIIAGRSGSAHAAQIGTMVVGEEIDAMRTLGIDPLQRLVLPKLLALAIALPLLTVFADLAGVFGGMVMARSQLDIGFGEFTARFGRVMQGSALLIGLGKSFVFAIVIVLIGCFQGLRTAGGADSVGRQTTASVVQAIFLVIVADALFSVAFNLLGL